MGTKDEAKTTPPLTAKAVAKPAPKPGNIAQVNQILDRAAKRGEDAVARARAEVKSALKTVRNPIEDSSDETSGDPDIQDLIEHSASRYGKGSTLVMSSGKLALAVRHWTSTGSIALDMAIGGPGVPGGIPQGRIVEVRGETSEGKSLIGYHAIISNQKQNGISILFDTEEATIPTHAVEIGVDPDRVVMPQPKVLKDGIPMWTVEEIVERIEFYLIRFWERKVTRPILIVWDSIAQTPSIYEKEQAPGDENYGRAKVGDHAKALSQAFRRLPGMFMRINAAMLAINQLRGGPPKRPGLPETKYSLGGRALGFAASVRIEVRGVSGGDVYDCADPKTRELIGLDIEAEVFKNKVSRPWRKARYRVYFERGIDGEALLPEQLVQWGVITKSGGDTFGKGIYDFPAEVFGTPKKLRLEAYIDLLEESPENREKIRQYFAANFKVPTR